jgi:hypothetical protein
MLDLDLYTDPAAIREPLQRLPSLRASAIRRIVVLHAARRAPRRDPASRACRIAVCYGVETGAHEAQILYGKVYPSAVCAELAAQAEATGAPAWLPELDMLLWRFPRDPGLPQLGALLDESTQLVHYRPEARATLRRSGAAQQGTLYAKTFRAAEGAELCERFAHLAKLSVHGGAFEVAAPLRYDPASRTFWQRGVEAPALAAKLDTGNCDALMELVARGLAELHAAAPRFGPTRSVTDLTAASLKRGGKIGRCIPELARTAQRTALSIAAHALDFLPAQFGQIHGDFHIDQLRLNGERLMVFDLDELAIGDPLEDLASFVVKCQLGDAHLAQAVRERLIEAYARLRPAAFDSRRMNWHLAAQWLHKASRAYVWQRPGWRVAATQMVEEAQRCVARLARSSA